MTRLTSDENIVLIGMPCVGKSTVGVLLAKALSREFLDTDLYIQARECRRLQDVIDMEGAAAFCAIEERYILTLECRGHVIATGGSVVYSEPAMEYLRAGGISVYLDIPFPELERRVVNLGSRGVVMGPGQTLEQLYRERTPLYRRWADIRISCSGLKHEQVIDEVVRELIADS